MKKSISVRIEEELYNYVREQAENWVPSTSVSRYVELVLLKEMTEGGVKNWLNSTDKKQEIV